MRKRNIFAVLGGVVVLGVAYVLASVTTLLTLAFGLETAGEAKTH